MIGAVASDFLPALLTAALGVAMYAMFISLLAPSVRGNGRLGLLVLLTAAGVWFFAMGWRVLSAPEGRGTAMPPNAVQCLIPTTALLWVLIQRFSIIPAASARLGCTFRVLGALGALLCVGMLCKLLYVPGGTYGCTVQQYGSLAFYFATCHELPQAIFELVRGSVSEQTLLTSLAMGCVGLCGLAAMLTTVPRSNPTKKDKAD